MVALRAGFVREGRAAGHAQGLAEGRAEMQRLASLTRSLDAHLAHFEDRYSESIADLALEIARQMLRGEPVVLREALLAVVRDSLRALPEGMRRPRLVLHPADVDLVRGQLGEELARANWGILEDHRIEPGGCRIESESGDVDATLAARWKRLAASLGRPGEWNAEDDAP
jgi:flagellar assembly protein FliH